MIAYRPASNSRSTSSGDIRTSRTSVGTPVRSPRLSRQRSKSAAWAGVCRPSSAS